MRKHGRIFWGGHKSAKIKTALPGNIGNGISGEMLLIYVVNKWKK